MNKGVLLLVELVQTVRRAQPQIAFLIQIKNIDAVTADARRISIIVTEMDKLFSARVVAVEPSQARGDPQVSFLILHDGIDPSVTRAVRRIWIGLVGLEGVPIVAIETILCPEPEEAAAVLENHVYRTLRQTLFDADVVKTQDAVTDLR